MSYLLMGAVCDADQMQVERGLLPTDRYVFLRLANRHNAISGLCWPGHGQLAEDTGLSTRTIGEATQALWRSGFIDWEERWIEGSLEQNTNLYTIHAKPHPESTPEKPRLVLCPVEARTGNRPRQDRPPIQVIAIPRHRPLKKKKGVEVVQPLQGGHAESAVPPSGICTTLQQISHEGHATDAEKPGINQGLKREVNQEGNKVVVVEAAPTKKSFFSSSNLSVLEEGDESVESGNGSVGKESGSPSAHRDSSDQPHPHGRDQAKLDPTNWDDALGQEYLPSNTFPVQSTVDCIEPQKAARPAAAPRPPDPLDAPFPPTAKSQRLGSQVEARELVEHFITVVQPNEVFKDCEAEWERTARLLLGVNSLASLKTAISYLQKPELSVAS